MVELDNKIKRISVADQVTEKMKKAIQDGKWQPYERMPSEADLAEMYGVNRLTVRVALQKLSTIGIVETKVGDGSYVVPFSLGKHMQNISEFFMTPELLDDVCDFRKVIEIECALLAMDKATKAELAELKKRCEEYEEYEPEYSKSVDKTQEERDIIINNLARLDLAIHGYICEMSHNALLKNAFTVAEEPVLQFLAVILKQRMDRWMKDGNDYPFGLHTKLYTAIKNKDREKCKEYYMEMIDHKIIYTKEQG